MSVLRDSLLVILGNMMLALGTAFFAVPANMIVGGATGLGLIVEKLCNVNYATIVFVVNMLALVIGYLTLGKKFVIGTVLSSFIFPIFLGLFENLSFVSHDLFLSTVYAGLLIGVGQGIVFRVGYSTGGMDVPALLVNKKTGIPLSLSINVLDSLILLGQLFFSSLDGILYGLMVVFISTAVIDRVMMLGEKRIQVFVISNQYEKIATEIFKNINRGCTFVHVTTGYLQNEQKAVLCVVNMRQSVELQALILAIDPSAFIISNEIHSVNGRGFTLPDFDIEK